MSMQLARTEAIKNDQSPHFTTLIELPYYFERKQRLKFAVYAAILSQSLSR
jgi:hypothetical protein